MKKSSVVTSLISIAALALPISLWAEHHEEEASPPALSEVWIIVPKNGMEADFAQAVADDVAYRVKGGDTRSWQAYTVAIGHTLNAVQFRASFSDWADQDAYEADSQEKELGKFWDENVHQYVDHYHRYLERTDWENSHWPEEEGDGPYYGVTTWSIKQGSGLASEAARKAMSRLAIDEGWDNNWLWLSRIGGKPSTAIVSSYANYADMAPPEQSFFEFASEKMGEEEAGKMFADFGSGFTGSDYTIWKHNEAMSIPDDDE